MRILSIAALSLLGAALGTNGTHQAKAPKAATPHSALRLSSMSGTPAASRKAPQAAPTEGRGTGLGSSKAHPNSPANHGATVPKAQNAQLLKGGSNGGGRPMVENCGTYDIGVTDNSLGFGAPSGTEILWMHKEGQVAGTTTVSSISTAWGSPLFGGGNCPPDGTPVHLGIWDDPNDDGNPNDLILLQEVNTVIVNGNTDLFQVVPLSPPVVTTGIYFIGAASSGTFPAPMDQTSASAGRAWVAGNTTGAVDFNNLQTQPLPPVDMDSIGFPSVFLLRANCGPIGGDCDGYDIGATDNSLGFGAPSGTEVLWMHKEGQVAGSTTVNSISTAWGSPLFGGGNCPPDGTPVHIGIWDDPNDDGNPNDLVLLQEVNTVIVNGNTDLFQVVPLSPPVVTSGIYFIGAASSGTFPAPMDQTTASAGRAWVAGNTTGPVDFNNLQTQPLPPVDMDSIGFPSVFLLRATCGGGGGGGGGPANDNCSTPTVVVGNGPFPWTNVGATLDGGSESCGTPTPDVWYTWNATCTGTATMALCGSGVDSVIAIYNGAGCPVAGTAIACNDDFCNGFDSQVSFSCTAGQDYTLRIGGFAGTQGSGNFTVNCVQNVPPGPCDTLDDGSSETSVGFGSPTGTEILWMNRQGGIGLSSVVTSISTAYGTPAFPGFGPANGDAARVGIWLDTDNDGDPTTGLVLLQTVNTTVANVDTDIFNVVPLSPPVVVQGTYFIGASTDGAYPAPLDLSVAGGGRSWIAGSVSGNGTIDYTNLNGSAFPPTNEDFIAPGVWLLRADCTAKGTIASFCAGDGTGSACPCINGTAGNGCGNSTNTSGANLTWSGVASLGADTLTLTATGHHPSTLALIMQGLDAGTYFIYGDGLRCIGSPLTRVFKITPANAATLTAPSASSTPPSPATISGQSAALGDVLTPGSIRGYQLLYRDPVNYCTPQTFNASNGVRVVWAP